MKVTIFDKDDESITYECTCGEKKILSFEKAETDKENSYFILNEMGRMSYACCCGCYCDGTLDKNIKRNAEWLIPAYKGFCMSCYNKYELGLYSCEYCGRDYEGNYDEDGEEKDYSFCSKECYKESCKQNNEDIDEDYLEFIENETPKEI